MIETHEPTAVSPWIWIGNTIWSDQHGVLYDVSPTPQSEGRMFIVTKHLASAQSYRTELWMDDRNQRLMYGKRGKWFAKAWDKDKLRWASTIPGQNGFNWVRRDKRKDRQPAQKDDSLCRTTDLGANDYRPKQNCDEASSEDELVFVTSRPCAAIVDEARSNDEPKRWWLENRPRTAIYTPGCSWHECNSH